MNITQAYLNSNPQITSAVFYIGSWYEENYTIDLFSCTSFSEFILVGTLPVSIGRAFIEHLKKQIVEHDAKLSALFEYQNVEELNLSCFSEKEWALLFSHIDYPVELFPFISFKPLHIVGSLNKDGFAFQVWENFRKISSHIRIESLRAYAHPQVLAWDSRKETSVEVSVIFPMYNIAQYLEQCLESVTKRKDDWIEFLFVNDGSPDNSREIVLEWAKKDSRIKLLDKENGGCASARQYALEKAQGRYVGFVDPDDFIDESMFYKLFRAALTGSYEISFCGYKEFYETTKQTKKVDDVLGWPYDVGTYSREHIWNLVQYGQIGIWRRIYSMELLKRANIHFYTELRRFDDLPFKVEVFANARSVVSIPEHLYYYRLSRPGQDVSADDERLNVHFDIFNHLNETIAGKKNQELTDCLQIVKISTHKFAVSKIKKQFLRKYCKMAIFDLKKTGSFFHTYSLVKKRYGKKNAGFYFALCLHLFGLAKKLSE